MIFFRFVYLVPQSVLFYINSILVCTVSEEKVRELSCHLAEAQIKQAVLKRDKANLSQVVALDSEIMKLKRDINTLLQMISQEKSIEVDFETDDTQSNR